MDPNSRETARLEDDFLKLYRGLSYDFHETKLNVILGMQFEMVRTCGKLIASSPDHCG